MTIKLRHLVCLAVSLFFFSQNIIAQCPLTASPVSGVICNGSSISLTVSGATTYSWSPATGLSATTGGTVTASPTSSIVYKVVGTCMPGNHKDSLTIPIIVNPKPTASFSFLPVAPQCASLPIQFTGVGTGTGLSYAWAFGDGNTSTSLSPSHTYTTATGNGTQSFTVTFTVTNSFGCTATATQNVTVNQIPSVAMGGTGAAIINGQPYFKVCTANPNALFTFTNTSTTSATNTNYVINWGDASPNFTGATWGPTLTHTYPIGLYTMTYTVTGGNGCTNTINYNVFVGSNPAVSLGSPGNTDICGGNSLTFPITNTTNNPPGTTYTVTFGDGTAPVTFNHPPPPSVTHQFNITSCSAGNGGLTAGATPFANSFTATITVTNPCGSTQGTVAPIYISSAPQASFSISPSSTICVNTSATFSNTSVGYNASGGACNSNSPAVWSISPATGWTSGSSFGNTFGLTDPNLWSAGTNGLSATFTTIGSYTITMITGSTMLCGLDTITQTICVVPPPTPSFNMTPPNGCAPSTITISNTSLGSAGCSSLGYNWSIAYSSGCVYYSSGSYIYSSGGSTATNPVFTFSTPGTYNISLNVTNVCGTFSTSNNTVVKDVPYITTASSITGACGTFTTNPASYFTANGCGGTISNYAWTFAGGAPATGSGASPGNVTFNTAGGHTINLIATNECGSTPASVSVPVYPIPTVSAGASSTICSGNAAFLNGSASNGTPWYNYSWSPSGTVNSPSSSGTNAYPNSTTTFTLSVSDYYGCSGSDTMVVTVHPTPVVGINAVPSTVCYGNSVVLTASGANTYLWSGSGLAATTGNPVTATPTVSGNFNVTGTTLFNCSATNSTYVTVNPLPSLSVSPAAINSICLGNSITLTAFGANTYQWKPAATLNTTSGNTVTATPTTNTTYTLIGTTVNGCKDSMTVQVNVNGLPNVTASTTPGIICPGQTKTLTAGGATSYTWTPVATLNTSIGNPVIATPFVTTTYIVTGSNGANCTDTASVVVTVKPIVALVILHTDSTICKNQTIDTLTVSGGAGYIWSPALGLNVTIGATVIASPTVTTKYFVTATNTVGCSITDSTFVTVNPLPPTDAGLDKTICFGTSATIGTAAVAGYSYAWLPVTALNIPTLAQPSANPIVNTTYILTQTEIITGCHHPDTMVVTVVPLPLPPTLGSNSPVCWYSNINLTASGAVGATYTWGGPNGFSSNSQNPTNPLALYADSGDYTCFQFIGGCNSQPDTIHVSMFPKPAALSGVNATICQGQSAPIGGAQVPGSTYIWTSTPTGYSNTAPSDTVWPTVTTTYTIAETDLHACQDSNNVVITVKPLPVLGYNYANPACMGIGVLFTNTSTGSIISRFWTFGDGFNSGINSPNHSYAAVGTYYLQLTATTTDGCIDSLADTITVVTVPIDTFSFTPHVGCGPLAVTFTNLSSGYFPTYTWDLGYNTQFYNGTTPPVTTYPSPFMGDTTYIVQLTASNVCGAVNLSDSIIVHPSPHADFGTNVSVGCSPLTIHFSNTSVGLPTSYLWDFGDGSPTDTSKIPANHVFLTGPNDTVYTITLIGYNACGTDTQTHTILVHPNTVVAFLNISLQNGCAPFTTVLTNYSTGATAFSWNFGNATFSTQNIDTVTYTAAGTYTIYLFANNGCSYSQDSTTVTVYPVPNVIATPTPQGICSGYSSNISLNSLAPATSFSWTVAQNGVTGGSSAAGTYINQTLSLTGATAGTAIYTITPSPSIYGCIGATINDTVSVSPSPTVTATPNTQTICEGSATAIALSGSIAGTTFSWINAMNNTTGATNAVGNNINQTLFCATPDTGSVTYTVTPNFNGCAGPPISVVIDVNPIPVITATPSTQTICTGAAPLVTLTSTVTGTSYAWTVTQTGVTGATASTGSIIGQTLTTTGNVSGTADYTITPTVNGCTGIPIIVTIIVNPYPAATATPALQTICSGNNTAINLTSTVIGTLFNWTVTPNLVAGASNSTGAVISQALTTTGTTPGTVTYTVTPSVGVCNGTPILVPINVNPIPIVSALPTSQTICSGDSSAINLSSNIAGTTYSWTVAQNGVSGATASSGSFINQQLNSTGNVIGTVDYTITPSANNCPGVPIVVTVTVNPIPVLTTTPALQTICSGNATAINLTSTVAGSTFAWVVPYSGVSGAASGSGITIAQTLTSIFNAIDSTVYTITPSANGCNGISKNVKVTVNPIPIATATPSSQTICNGNAPLINLTSNIAGTTFAYTVVQSSVIGGSNGIGASISQPLHTTGNFTGSATYTITPSANGCTGLPITVTITVNPSPVLNIIPSNDTVCVGVAVTFSFADPGLSSYFWKFGDGLLGTTNPVVHQYASNGGSFTATLIGTSVAFGCTDSTTQVITILPTPIINITATPTFGCGPLTVVFSNSTPFSSFNQWNFGDVNTSNNYAPTHTYTASGSFNVVYYSTNSSGCKDTAYIPIQVFPSPAAAFIMDDTFACSPPAQAIAINTTSGATNYSWNDGNGGSSNLTNPTFTYNTPGTFNITLTASNSFGCSASVMHPYILYPTPHADVVAAPLVGCEPLVVFLSDNSTNGIYNHWSFGDGTYATNSPTITHVYSTPGVYDVKLNIEGVLHLCSDSIYKTKYITVLPKPTAIFTYDNLNTPEPDVKVNFNSQSLNASSYIWSYGDASALFNTTDTFASHGYANYGTYTVILVAIHPNGCTDTANQVIETGYVTGLFVPNAMSPLAGANDEVKVFLPKGLGLKTYHVQIFSTWGEKLWESTLLDEHGSPKEAWDGKFKNELLPQDVYVWKIDGVFTNQHVWSGNSYDGKKFSQTGTVTLLR